MFHQLDKYLKRLLLELDPCTVSTQFAGTGIDLKVTEAINRIGLICDRHTSAIPTNGCVV
jgi:hypothetical protein